MNTKQLKDVLSQIEALETLDRTPEFQAGVDAAQAVISTVMQEATDRERIQKLEAELAQLRAKYPSDSQAAPKKRGRKPKDAPPQEQALLESE